MFFYVFSQLFGFFKNPKFFRCQVQAVRCKRGRCSQKKPGSPQVTTVDVGETDVRRVGAPGATGETQMRGDRDAPVRSGETPAVRRAAETM